jgi:hypothetical protein
MIRYSVTTMSEAPYLLFVLLAVLAVDSGRPMAGGILGGLSFLIRPEGLVMTAGLSLFQGRRFRAFVPLLFGFVLSGVVPALLFNHHTSGQWTLTRKGVNITSADGTMNEPTPERTVNPPEEVPLAERIRLHAGSMRRAYPGRLVSEARHLARAVGWPAVVLLPVGILAGPALAAGALLPALAVPLFPGVPPAERLVVPLIPFVLLLAGSAARRVGAWPAVPRRGTWIVAVVLAVGWLAATVPRVRSLTINEDGYFPELVQAGRALAPMVTDTTLVFCRKPYTAFYAGARYQTTPLGEYHATIDAVRAAGGDFLVVSEVVSHIYRPALLPLVEDSGTMFSDPRLKLVYFDPTYAERHVAVYRVLRPGAPEPPGLPPDQVAVIRSRIPHDPKRHRFHAQMHFLAGRSEAMLQELEWAVEANPEDIMSLRSLAAALLDLNGDPARAFQMAEQALRLKPDDREALALMERARAKGLR